MLDFDKIQGTRDALVQSLTRWKGRDGFYRSSPTFPDNSRPSFTNTGIVLQAYNESGNLHLAQPLADALLLRLHERDYLPFPNEKTDIPHIMCNSWPIFSILDCYPSKVTQLKKLCHWFVDSQADNKSWYLIADEPTSYPITTAYAISALLQFYDCNRRFLERDDTLLTTISARIQEAIDYLLSHRTVPARRDGLYLWPASLDDSSRHTISFSTSANCIHVIAKASRLLVNKEWSERTARTLEAVVDGFAATPGDDLAIEGYEIRLWDEVQMNESSINYTWSFFAPINLTTVLRFVREDRFLQNEHYYRFIEYLTDWILTNHNPSGDIVGVRGSKSSSQTRVWSTASSVIVLSRLLAKRYELAKLERAVLDAKTPVLDAKTPGHDLVEFIDITLRESETGTVSVARKVRWALNTLLVLIFAGLFALLGSTVESTWATIEGRVTFGTLLVSLIAAIIGVNVRRWSDQLVVAVCHGIDVCKMTYRILHAVGRRTKR